MSDSVSAAINQDFVEFPPLSPFITLNGPIFARILGADDLELGFSVQKKNTNLNGSCHGAVLMGLLDSVMGAYILYQLSPEYSVVTLSLSTNFICSAQIGDFLIGRASIDGHSKSNVFVAGNLRGPNGMVATATGTFAKVRSKDESLNFREIVNKKLNVR